MKTIVLNESGRLSLTETPPSPESMTNQALVRVRRVGICGSDLHAFKGEQPFFTYPRVLGHELGVEILSIGENTEGLHVGDRCAVEPYLHCGQGLTARDLVSPLWPRRDRNSRDDLNQHGHA